MQHSEYNKSILLTRSPRMLCRKLLNHKQVAVSSVNWIGFNWINRFGQGTRIKECLFVSLTMAYTRVLTHTCTCAKATNKTHSTVFITCASICCTCNAYSTQWLYRLQYNASASAQILLKIVFFLHFHHLSHLHLTICTTTSILL